MSRSRQTRLDPRRLLWRQASSLQTRSLEVTESMRGFTTQEYRSEPQENDSEKRTQALDRKLSLLS